LRTKKTLVFINLLSNVDGIMNFYYMDKVTLLKHIATTVGTGMPVWAINRSTIQVYHSWTNYIYFLVGILLLVNLKSPNPPAGLSSIDSLADW